MGYLRNGIQMVIKSLREVIQMARERGYILFGMKMGIGHQFEIIMLIKKHLLRKQI